MVDCLKNGPGLRCVSNSLEPATVFSLRTNSVGFSQNHQSRDTWGSVWVWEHHRLAPEKAGFFLGRKVTAQASRPHPNRHYF